MTKIYECIIQQLVNGEVLHKSVKYLRSEQQAKDWCRSPVVKVLGTVIALQGIPIIMEREVE